MTTAAHAQQTAERPPLTLVKDDTPQPVEGTVVEHQGESATRPAWLTAVYDHARDHRLYVPQIGRGYAQLTRRWFHARRDYWPQQIATAEADLAAAGSAEAQSKARATLDLHRARYRQHKRIHSLKSGGWAATATLGTVAGAWTGGVLFDIGLGLTALGIGAWQGRPESTRAQAAAPSPLAGPSPTPLTLDERPVGIDDDYLQQAINSIGFPGKVRILDVSPGADDTSTTVFDLPTGVPVEAVKRKIVALAAALGRDVSMIDLNKAGAEGRASLWMTSRDPFGSPRPSPLLTMTGTLDAFGRGIPVAWNKRGEPVVLPVSNSSFVIAGMTRSGKGVGAANLIAGAAMDPRINLRIVAGKENGEWDSYAKAGVAATYFKPSPERLLALLKALIADMGRRNRDLGKWSKSKVTADTLIKIGGLELLVIDEVATYTRPGKRLREEILEALIELSAVAAGAGILLVLITQYPEVDVLPQALAMNCGTRWAMRVDNATQSNAVLGGSASSSGRDASKFDPPLPGLGWLVNPFAGVTDKARSFDLDEDERGEITELMKRAAAVRKEAGRLVGQWDDPIESALLSATGLSSAAGGPAGNGVPGRTALQATPEQRQQAEAMRGALIAMNELGRDVAQTQEMAELIGGSMTAARLGDLLRDGGAGGTVKIEIPGRTGRVNGYRRADIKDALEFLSGA
ncbi:hypothetical protein ACFU8I_02915 [Streptomyces sp. NPDC057540]|uniref:hypothetical protein n=1 Tax=Streptomyces sp. NPDC057540 TaxID=3346160 RepID=UPI003687E5BF